MKAYIKLVNFELNRFVKLYVWLAAVIFMIQLATTIIKANLYMSRVTDLMREGMSQAEIISMYDYFGLLHITNSFGFILPIVIGIVALLFYMIFIWYRDWLARTSFVYHLLTLPTARINVFFAKITTIMISVLGLISMQFVMMKLFEMVLQWIVPTGFRSPLTVTEVVYHSPYLGVLYPLGIMDFLVHYGLGLTFVVLVFTMILLERSFRYIGILFGIGYFALCSFICLLPIILQTVFDSDLFVEELFFVELGTILLVMLLSIGFSRFLLNKKITV